MSLFFAIFAFLGTYLYQDYQYVGSVEVESDLQFSDPIGNVYLVKDNSLIKYDATRKRIADYTNAYLGKIFSVDVSDPLRILVYYKNHNQILWLDNYLSEIRSPVFLDALGVDQAELVCSSSQGGFWVLNGLSKQIQYFDAQLHPVHESMVITELTGPDTSPDFLIEKSRQIFLNIPGTGILIFDRFGNYSKILDMEVPSSFQVTDRMIFYFRDGLLYGYDMKDAENISMNLPFTEEIVHAELQPDYLYLFSKKAYLVYKISR